MQQLLPQHALRQRRCANVVTAAMPVCGLLAHAPLSDASGAARTRCSWRRQCQARLSLASSKRRQHPLLPAEGYEGILGGTLTRRRTPSPVARWDRLLPPVRWDLPSCQPGRPPPPSSTSQVGVSQHQRSGSRWRSPRMPRRPSPWQRAERQRATSTQ